MRWCAFYASQNNNFFPQYWTNCLIFWRFADRASQYIYLSNWPTWCTKVLFYNKFISCIYMFRAHVLIISRSKLHYTASGIIIPTGGRLVHVTATYTCDDTRGCVTQFWPPDDEHMCSKHVEAWNKNLLWNKFCASIWLNSEININVCFSRWYTTQCATPLVTFDTT